VYFGVGYPGLLILPIVLYILIIRNNINRFPTSSSIRGSAFIVLLVILTLLICVDISKLYFWTVSINVNDVKPSLLSNIKENILSITEFKGVYSYCISIAVISILIVVQYVRGVLTSRYSIVYLILLLLSMYWRISGSYKVLPAFAVLIAIVLFSIDSIKFEKRSMFIVFSIFLMMTISYAFFGQLKDKLAYSKHEINNSEVFNMNGICKASEGMGDGCHCIQTLVFGPQFYLYNDIKQCKYQINTWSSRMGLSNEYMDIVRTSIDSGAAAFYVPTKEYVEGDLPLQEIISLIRAKYACRKLENGFELCKP
jgi:hypothetical protein